MRFFCAIFVLILLFPNLVRCENLSLQLEILPTELIVGLPFLVKITLKSNTDFTLHGGLGFCDSEHTKIAVKDSSGNPIDIPAFDCEGLSVTTGLFDSDAKKTYQGSLSTEDEMYLPAGTYKISAEYSSLGPYLDKYSETDIRPVEGIWIGKLNSNEVKIIVKNPEGEDQLAFQALRPPQEKLESPENKLSWFIKLNREPILQDFPKSNYAAWVLWKNGQSDYISLMDNDTLSVEDEFNFPKLLKENGMKVSEYRWDTITGILEPWERLNKDFPNFYKRPEILKGLSQVYIRIDESQKAVPLIKELLEKYPDTDEAKKVADYKAWMQQKNIWN
jgi:hypothetical protein